MSRTVTITCPEPAGTMLICFTAWDNKIDIARYPIIGWQVRLKEDDDGFRQAVVPITAGDDPDSWGATQFYEFKENGEAYRWEDRYGGCSFASLKEALEYANVQWTKNQVCPACQEEVKK